MPMLETVFATDSEIILTCKYMDRDFAAQNDFDFACTNSVFMGREYNPLMFDDVNEFCTDCPIYKVLCNAKKNLTKCGVWSVIHA